MAKLPMKRITLLAHKKDRKAIMELLQRRGAVQISDIEEQGFEKLDTSASRETFEKNRKTAQKALEILTAHAPEKKKGVLAAFKGKKTITLQQYGELASQNKQTLSDCYAIVGLDKDIERSKAEIARLQSDMDALQPWINLDVLPARAGLNHARILAGTLPQKMEYDELALKMGELLIKDGEEQPAAAYEIISSEGNMTCLLAISHVAVAAKVETALRTLGLRYAFDHEDTLPRKKLQELKEQKLAHEENIRKQKNAIAKMAKKRADIEFLIDYLAMRRDKYHALEGLALTSHTFLLKGYIPKTALSVLQELERYNAVTEVSDPPPDEEAPVLLQNNGFVEGVEPITEMFSLPSKEDLDPNPVMSIFYYMLFGIMLSDAAYGVIMVLVSMFALKKLVLKPSMYKTMKLFLYCGISTIFWGAMFGSWFGDVVAVVSKTFFGKEIVLGPVWFAPLENPMQMLMVSCIIGVIHMLFGLGMKFCALWKLGKKWDALFDAGFWMILLLGLLGMVAGSSIGAWIGQVGQYMALAGACGIVLTGGREGKNVFSKLALGLYSLYGISGYLSDVLSYSRLLALGLATGVVATVFNSIAAMGGSGVFGAVIFTVVFIAGHAVNIGINLLGAYVHTNRLQYVEFFSKFYNGGGRAFNPLQADTKYYTVKEDH